MVKEVRYLQCDCEEGKLEHIASTKGEGSINSMRGECGTYRSTHFFGCNKCDAVYRIYSAQPSVNWEDIFFERLRKYEGKLTKEEIKQYASECKGGIKSEDEERIMKRRQK